MNTVPLQCKHIKTRLATVALLVATVFVLPLTAKGVASFRIIPIAESDFGYQNFESTVISSQKELDLFFSKYEIEGVLTTWDRNLFANFKKAIVDAKLDFDREALVLLQHTECEITGRAPNFIQPLLKNSTLICQIDKPKPSEVQIALHASIGYCLALVVVKADVATVELKVTDNAAVEKTIRIKVN